MLEACVHTSEVLTLASVQEGDDFAIKHGESVAATVLCFWDVLNQEGIDPLTPRERMMKVLDEYEKERNL